MVSPIFAANPTFIQRHGKKGKFELIVAHANGSSLYNLTRHNESTPYPWTLTKTFADNIGVVAGLSVIEGPFNSPPNLELIVNNDGRLVHFNNDPKGDWYGPNPVAPDTPILWGAPAFYQTKPVKSGAREDFEVIAPSAAGGVVWLWRDNNTGSGPYPWSKPTFFGQSLGTVTSVTVIPNPQFLELIVTVGSKLHYFYRAIDRAAKWQGPSTVRPEYDISPNASLVTSTRGILKNDFVLVVPPLSGGGFLSFERNNKLSPAPWGPGTLVAKSLGHISSTALIHGDLGSSENNLEVIVNAKGVLYLLTLSPGSNWNNPTEITWN